MPIQACIDLYLLVNPKLGIYIRVKRAYNCARFLVQPIKSSWLTNNKIKGIIMTTQTLNLVELTQFAAEVAARATEDFNEIELSVPAMLSGQEKAKPQAETNSLDSAFISSVREQEDIFGDFRQWYRNELKK